MQHERDEQVEKDVRQGLEMNEGYRRQKMHDEEYWASLSRGKRDWSEAAEREHDERARGRRQHREMEATRNASHMTLDTSRCR